MTPKAMNIPEVIPYCGWIIYGWTGWKGTKGKVYGDSGECPRCGRWMITGDTIYLSQSEPKMHWICKYPDNRKDTLQAQWLASKDAKRFVMANCAIMPMADLPAGEYKRGECFDVVPEHFAITEDTPADIREAAKQIGFERLKLLIDQLEDAFGDRSVAQTLG